MKTYIHLTAFAALVAVFVAIILVCIGILVPQLLRLADYLPHWREAFIALFVGCCFVAMVKYLIGEDLN